MITALIVVALCYIIPTILMLLFFKYTEIGKTASDDEVFRDSFIPVMNIFYVFFMITVLVNDLLKQIPKPTFVDSFKRKVLKFVRGN